MNHYYTNNQNLKEDEYSFVYTYKNNLISFKSMSGVFAKSRVDFGTNVLINSLEELNVKSILDVGCGVGVIGITLAKAYPSINVEMIDINERAVKLCNENIKLNKINNAVSYVSNCYENVNNSYDMIITNPPIRAGKEIIYKIVTDAKKYLNIYGLLYVVIQKKQGAASMKTKLLETFENVDIINKEKGYYIYKCIKNKE